MIVASYRASVVNKRTILAQLFANVRAAYAMYAPLRDRIATWTDNDLLDLPQSDERQDMLAQREAWQTTYEDSAAAMILIAAASLERLYYALRESLYSRGVESYVKGLRFSRAVWALAVQYKHLGEWRHAKELPGDSSEVEQLVGDALRADAAAEFLRRCAFESYADFERALLSCSEGFSPANVVPSGDRGIPSVKLRGVAADEAQD